MTRIWLPTWLSLGGSSPPCLTFHSGMGYLVRDARHGIVSHTQDSFYIWGGVVGVGSSNCLPPLDLITNALISNQLYKYNTTSRRWTDPVRGSNPQGRAFHTAARMGTCMVVYGGLVHEGAAGAPCAGSPLNCSTGFASTLQSFNLLTGEWSTMSLTADSFVPLPR